jgi:hypothetical protein
MAAICWRHSKALKMLALDVKIRQLHHGYLVIWIQKSMVANVVLSEREKKTNLEVWFTLINQIR